MNKLLLLTISILILLSSFVIAQEQYVRPGVTIPPLYQQNGAGTWDAKEAIPYSRAGTYNSYFPLVDDIDNDNNNEIIVINNNELTILNYTTGAGLITEQAITHGTTQISTAIYYITPSLFDTDNDGTKEIVSWNGTHMLMYSYNGTQIVLNQSVSVEGLVNNTHVPLISNLYPVIQCASGNNWASGNNTCVIELNNRSGGNQYLLTITYDLESNIARASNSFNIPNGHADINYHNTHLYDGDGDGYYEIYHSFEDAPNGDYYIYGTEISATGTLTKTLLYTHLETYAGSRYTDIIVLSLNGATPSITYGYTNDGTNFDARTIKASDGSVITSSYCSVFTCPEGDQLSANMWLDLSTTWGIYGSDVCYYIRDYAGTDIVHCISEYAGSDRKETEIINTAYNFTKKPIIHEAELAGVGIETLLTPKFMAITSGIKTAPTYTSTDVCIPVDTQKSGTLDFICQNKTILTYNDDGYQNTNYDFTGLSWDTGNSICQNDFVAFTLGIKDVESDSGVCYYTEMYGNYTQISNSSNSSITSSQFANGLTTEVINYFGGTVGTFVLRFNCKDQYHTSYDTQDYIVTVSNDTTSCHPKGVGGSSITIITTIPTVCNLNSDCPADYECTEQVCVAVKPVADSMTDVMSDIGILGTGGKAFFWLLLMIALAFLIFSSYSGEGVVYIIALLEVVMLVMGWVLGMVGTVPLVIIGLLCGVLLTFMWMKGNPGGG